MAEELEPGTAKQEGHIQYIAEIISAELGKRFSGQNALAIAALERSVQKAAKEVWRYVRTEW
ncbi:MAG: hypothetical protein QQN63_05320 [Nitrosopumilus sp.]